jgi:hypothetical protein
MWVNREDARGVNIFEGGFLGLGNIGPFDRSVMLPGDVLEQSDGTVWMAKFCLDMLEMALLLDSRNSVYEDVGIKFFEHFALIPAAMGRAGWIFLRPPAHEGRLLDHGAGAFDGGPSASLRRSGAGRLVMAAIAYVSRTGPLVP